jgi:hypothetical protein
MIIELTLLPIAMIVVFLRLWVRISWLKKSWYDDYLMILAMVFSIGTHEELASTVTTSNLKCRYHRDCDNGIPAIRLGSPCVGSKAPRDDGGQTGTTMCDPCYYKPILTVFRHPSLVRHCSFSPRRPSRCRSSSRISASHQRSHSSASSSGQPSPSCLPPSLSSWSHYGYNACMYTHT